MKQDFISAEQFSEIKSRIENIAKQEKYQAVISNSLKKAEIARAISELYIAEHQNDKLKTAQIAGNLLFFFVKNNMVCFDENTEGDLRFAWEIFVNENDTYESRPTEMLLDILKNYEKEYIAKRKIISFRGITYPIASIYISGYNPHSFLIEMIKEKESRITELDSGAYTLEEAWRKLPTETNSFYFNKEDSSFFYFEVQGCEFKIKKWYQADYEKCKIKK